MKLLILGAGYATRLYPLTQDQPKALLPVAGRPMLEHVVEKFAVHNDLDRIYIVTNAKFAGHFERWAVSYMGRQHCAPIEVINDGTSSDATKLGAVGDMELVVRQKQIADDLVVVAGDNLFDEPADGFLAAGRRYAGQGLPTIAIYDVRELDEVRKKYNFLKLDPDGRVVFFSEKDPNATSTLTAICLYYFPQTSLKLIARYLSEGNNPDQPGRYIGWLYQRTRVYTYQLRGRWFDVGSEETLQQADRDFAAA